MLTSMNEPVTEAGLNRVPAWARGAPGHVSREFASTYAEGRADPREAWANLSAMRAKGEVPPRHIGLGKSDFDGARQLRMGRLRSRRPLPRRSRRWTMRERSNARQTEPASSSDTRTRCYAQHARPGPPPRRRLLIKRIALCACAGFRNLGTTSVNEGRNPVENATIGTEVLDQESSNCNDNQTETTSAEKTNSLMESSKSSSATKVRRGTRRPSVSIGPSPRLLGAIAGTDDLGEIKHAHCVAYIQNLSNLPKSYGKSQRDAELSIADLLERGQRLRPSGQGRESRAQSCDGQPAYHTAFDHFGITAAPISVRSEKWSSYATFA